jgi:hypothetical protein
MFGSSTNRNLVALALVVLLFASFGLWYRQRQPMKLERQPSASSASSLESESTDRGRGVPRRAGSVPSEDVDACRPVHLEVLLENGERADNFWARLVRSGSTVGFLEPSGGSASIDYCCEEAENQGALLLTGPAIEPKSMLLQDLCSGRGERIRVTVERRQSPLLHPDGCLIVPGIDKGLAHQPDSSLASGEEDGSPNGDCHPVEAAYVHGLRVPTAFALAVAFEYLRPGERRFPSVFVGDGALVFSIDHPTLGVTSVALEHTGL